MRFRLSYGFMMGVFLMVNLQAWSQVSRDSAWQVDLAFVQRELPRLHKNLFFERDSVWFNTQMDALRGQVGYFADEDILIRLQEIVASIGDSHTSVKSNASARVKETLPLEFFWFEEGVFVLVGQRHCQEALGRQLVEINGHPVEDVLDSLEQVVALDNLAMKWDRVSRLLRQVPLLRHYGFVLGDTIPVTVRDSQGMLTRVQLISNAVRLESAHRVEVRYQPAEWPQGWKHPDAWFWDEWLAQDSIYFVQYNTCWSKEVQRKQGKKKYAANLPAFKPFADRVIHTLETRPVKALVIDLRFNGGGSSRQGTKWIREIAALRPPHRPKQIYVLTGRKTFSSAIINLLDARKHLAAVTVGEMTGGKANHYGEVKSFTTPNGKLTVNYSSRYHRYNNLNEDTIRPDIEVAPKFSDFSRGRDGALDAVRERVSGGSF